MKRRVARGLGRRGFLGAALAGGVGVVAARGHREGGGRGGAVASPGSAAARGRGRARAADPWAPLREEVISPDELEPSGRDLAG